MDTAISVARLTRAYGKRRGVIDLSFDVVPGEIFGFLGPNGAGKTTTIRLLMGMLRPHAGAARVFGMDCWADAPAVKARIGFLPGEMRLYEKWTGTELLDFFADLRGGPAPRRRELVERLELDLRPRIAHLSKGNRQKLAVVQALMHDAPLLVLDEPSSGLDPLMQIETIELLREERSRGKTVFLSSHMLPEVERMADRVAIIREGRIVMVEDVEQLRAVRERRMEVILREPLPAAFEGIPGVRLLSTHEEGRHVALAVRGDPVPLLRRLGDLPVADFTYGPPDLEGVFLQYYGTGVQPAPVREHEEVAS
jgi:ABC-2 type transport system ATP-binding protein